MKKIHILGHRSCFTRHFHPIRVFRNTLLQNGIKIKYYDSPLKSNIQECDVLLIFEASYREILPLDEKNRASAITFLMKFLENFKHVIWFDDSDSSGILRSYVFPYVHTYAKAQILKDLSYYKESHLTGAIHRDYAHETSGVQDTESFKQTISSQNCQILTIGWNLAMNNWVFNNCYHPLFSNFVKWTRKDYDIIFTPPNLSKRDLDVTYRGSLWERVPTVNWWRKKTRDVYNNFVQKRPELRINPPGKVSKLDYHNEMRQSIVSLSPFGVGEICYRDFESFFCGSLLFKPDMNHIDTWPDLFIDGKTYVSHKWDFSDFEDKLEDILSFPKRYEDIAREGQNQFRVALTDRSSFAENFINLIS